MPRKPGDKDLKPRIRPVMPNGYKQREVWRKRSKRSRDYYEKRGKNLDVVLFSNPHKPEYYHRICWRSHCKREFWTNNPHLRYCNDYCRTQHHNCTDEGHAHKGMIWLTRGNI